MRFNYFLINNLSIFFGVMIYVIFFLREFKQLYKKDKIAYKIFK